MDKSKVPRYLVHPVVTIIVYKAKTKLNNQQNL